MQTLFDQLDRAGTSWKIYNQDMGNDPARDKCADHCGVPGAGDPSGAGVPNLGGAEAIDQYVPKHNPAPWFHSLTDDPKDCRNVVPLDGFHATPGHAAIPSIAQDQQYVRVERQQGLPGSGGSGPAGIGGDRGADVPGGHRRRACRASPNCSRCPAWVTR